MKVAREFFSQVSHLRRVREAVFRDAQHAESLRRIQDLLVQVCRRITRNADVVHVVQLNTRGFETVTDRLFREPGTMLDAIEAFFFDRGDQSAVLDDCR